MGTNGAKFEAATSTPLVRGHPHLTKNYSSYLDIVAARLY